MLEAIVLGTGGSLYDFLKRPVLPNVKLLGCSVVPQYVNNLDYYVYADTVHKDHLPQVPFHPNCQIITPSRLWQSGYIKWDDQVPHGGTSGGMAVSYACSRYQNIGLVGFDSLDLNYDFIQNFHKEVLNFWQSKGKCLYTLMEKSVFNNRLLPYDYDHHTP
jgi:hypothetical protein